MQSQPAFGSLIGAILVSLIAGTANAQQFSPSWQLQFDLAFVNPSGDGVAVSVGQPGVNVDVDNEVGAGLRLQYQFAPSWSTEFGFLATSSVGASVGAPGTLVGVASTVESIGIITAGANYHFLPEGKVDLFAGPFVAAVNYGDIDITAGIGSVGTRQSVDTEFTVGVIAGLEMPIGNGGWSLQSNVRYIDANMESNVDGDRLTGDLDPFIFSVGIAYRF